MEHPEVTHKVKALSGFPEGDTLYQFYDEENKEFVFPIITNDLLGFGASLHLSKEQVAAVESDKRKVIRVCILDSGILTNHPAFKDRITDLKDFTGEEIEDLNGHGSMVTYLSILGVMPFAEEIRVELIIGKVLDKHLEASEETLIAGIEWAMEQDVTFLNISAGIDRTFLGINRCNGTCKLCKAAERAANVIPAVRVAAGNDGNTLCPARSGVKNKHSKVVAVGALDKKTNAPHKWSGRANIYTKGDFRVDLLTGSSPGQRKLAILETAAHYQALQGNYKAAKVILTPLLKRTDVLDEEKIYTVRKQLNRLELQLCDELLNTRKNKEAETAYLSLLPNLYVDSREGDKEYMNLIFGTYLHLGVAQKHFHAYNVAQINLNLALSHLESGEVVCKDSRLFNLYESLGFCHLKHEEYKMARKYFEKALSFSPPIVKRKSYEYNSALLNLASVLLYLGDRTKAKTYFKKGLALAKKQKYPTLIAFTETLKQRL